MAAVAEVPEADLEPRLHGLVRRELLRREMDARSPERGQYAFVQALIREVAYNTLSKKDRKKLHLAAARYFESLGNDEIAGALASHYLAAHANAAEGEEADALAGQARIALKAAASRASALGSFDQAVSFLEQALTVTEDPDDRIELLLQAAGDARTAGRIERAEMMVREALALATKAANRDQILRTTIRLGDLLLLELKVDEGQALLEPALTEFADADDGHLAEIRLQLARVHYLRGDFHDSLAVLEPVLETLERRGLLRPIAEGLILRGNALWSTGRRREAYGAANVALEVAVEHGFSDLQLRIRGNLANALTESDARASFDSWRELHSLARKLGQRGQLIRGIGNFGYSAFLAGEWDAGLSEMDAFLAEDLPANSRFLILNNAAIIRANRGEGISAELAEMAGLGAEMSGNWLAFITDPTANAALAAGDLRKARDSFFDIAEADPGVGMEYFYRAVRAALWRHDLSDVKAVVARYEETGDFGPVADARRATMNGGIAALEGRPAEALAHYRDAMRGWRATHVVWDEALTGLDMAEFLDLTQPEVAAAIASTREILERLGARPYLERLDAAAARHVPKAATTSAQTGVRTGVAVSE